MKVYAVVRGEKHQGIEATKDNEVAFIRGSLPYALNKFNMQNNSNIRITTRTVPDGIRVWRIA